MKKTILSLCLVFVFVMQCSVVAFASENTTNPAQGYYSEQEAQRGDSALSVIDDAETAHRYANIQAQNAYDIVSATKQTVYVIDSFDDNGVLSESRLMTPREVSHYKSIMAANPSLKGNTWVGEDEEEHQGGKLSIYLVVYKDTSRNYYAYGTANWENGIYSGGVNGPSSGYDFLAITWGGGGELKNSSSSDRSISGIYQYNQGNISFSRAQSDTYCGYCWQFNETKGAYFADYIDCYAKLKKTYTTYRGKETNIRLTYIHTYQEAVGTISFEGGTSGAAAGVSLSSCNKQWQIEIDVPGIYY